MSDCTVRPRNCRHCTHMTCGDANYCDETQETMSDAAISVRRSCDKWEWNPIDALTLDGIDDGYREARERALYEKRMRGDWS